MAEIRIATRRSNLAVAQANWVGAQIRAAHPGTEVRLVEVVTTGDTDRSSPVATLTEVGAFVRAVQRAVLEGGADIAVHSCKDLPVAGPAELRAFYPARETPWDVMCGASPADLAPGARVGTGSPRRQAQLRALRPDLEIAEIRGNVDTRLAKVASGEYDAVVLAEAGLRRLGLEDAIDHRFSVNEMVPAPAQAALAVEAVTGTDAAEIVASIEDETTRVTVGAERLVLERTGAGCRAALGVFARSRDGSLDLAGFVEDDGGPRRADVSAGDPEAAVERLIEDLGL